MHKDSKEEDFEDAEDFTDAILFGDAGDTLDLGGGEEDIHDQSATLLDVPSNNLSKPKKKKSIPFFLGYLVGLLCAVAVEGLYVGYTLVVDQTYEVAVIFFGAILAVAAIFWFSCKKTSHKKWIVVCLASGTAGFVGGTAGAHYMDLYFSFAGETSYYYVDAESSNPATYSNAASIEFTNITRVHYEIAGSQEVDGAWRCAAPLQAMDDTPALAASFWAVDDNCCSGTDASSMLHTCLSWARTERGESMWLEGEPVSCEQYTQALVNAQTWFGYSSYEGYACVRMEPLGFHDAIQSHRLTYGILCLSIPPVVWPICLGMWYLLACCCCTVATMNWGKWRDEKIKKKKKKNNNSNFKTV